MSAEIKQYTKENRILMSVRSQDLIGERMLRHTSIALYIFLTTISVMSIFDGMPTALKLAHIPVIGMCMLSLSLGIKKEGMVAGRYLVEYMAYILLMFAITSLVYATEQTDMAQMKRGYVKLFYQLLTVLIAVSAYYLYGKKAMLYTFYGFAAFNSLAVLLAFAKTGSAAVGDFIYFLTSGGDAQGFMKFLELHDGTFSFGVFLIYFLVEGVKKYKKETFIAAVFFFLGFKRIGIIAIIAVLPVWWLLKDADEKRLKKAGIATGLAITALGFSYVLFTYFRVFEIMTTAIGIDTMGRNELYEFIRDYYRIDMLYTGRGFEFVTQLMKTAHYGTMNMSKIGAIHNGYLTVYIELGFFGFFLWAMFWLIWHMRWQGQFGRKAILAYILVTIYLYITYFTDNTAFYFFTGITARLLPMVFSES